MSNHLTQTVTDKNGRFFGRCNCGWDSGANHFLNRWQAEDLIAQHVANVQRARANLHRGGGSITNDMKHAERMIADPATPESDKVLWQMLHDGYARRLAEKYPTTQAELF